MNYTKHYNLLVGRAKERELTGYKEKHHIIPRCLEGNDEKENLVELTAEEHYLAHLLLVKIFPDNVKLVYAAVMMICGGKNHQRTNNKLYGWLKRKHSQNISLRQQGESNTQYGTCWITNSEIKKCIKINKNLLETYLEAGWIKKRVINWDKILIKSQKEEEKKRGNIKKELEKKKYYIDLFESFKNGDFKNLSEFINDINFKLSKQMLVSYWRRYINLPELSWGKCFGSSEAKEINRTQDNKI